MPYSFNTIEGEGAIFRLKTRYPMDTYTVTAEFTEHPSSTLRQEAPFLTLPVEVNGVDLTITLTAEQVNSVGTAYYRVRAVKAGVDIFIENGKIIYLANKIADSSIHEKKLAFDPVTQIELNAALESLGSRSAAARLLGLTESALPIGPTAGTTLTTWSSLAFDSTGQPVKVSLSGGTFSAAGPVTITFDLYDAMAAKVVRQVQRTYPAASTSEPIPAMSRVIEPTPGPRVIFFRIKPSANVALTLVTSLTAPDESPLQLLAEEVAHA